MNKFLHIYVIKFRPIKQKIHDLVKILPLFCYFPHISGETLLKTNLKKNLFWFEVKSGYNPK